MNGRGRANLIPEITDDPYEEYEEGNNFLHKNNGWKEAKSRSSRKFQDGSDRRTYFREKLFRRSRAKFQKWER